MFPWSTATAPNVPKAFFFFFFPKRHPFSLWSWQHSGNLHASIVSMKTTSLTESTSLESHILLGGSFGFQHEHNFTLLICNSFLPPLRPLIRHLWTFFINNPFEFEQTSQLIIVKLNHWQSRGTRRGSMAGGSWLPGKCMMSHWQRETWVSSEHHTDCRHSFGTHVTLGEVNSADSCGVTSHLQTSSHKQQRLDATNTTWGTERTIKPVSGELALK